MTVISELLGVAEHDRDHMHRMVHTIFDATTPPEKTVGVHAELQSTLGALAEYKAREPGDDLTNALLQVRAEGNGGGTGAVDRGQRVGDTPGTAVVTVGGVVTL